MQEELTDDLITTIVDTQVHEKCLAVWYLH